MNLRIPGPTPLHPKVAKALERPMINHRGPIFAGMQKSIIARLQRILETENEIIIYPSSGTGGLEASLANILSPGDRVLGCAAGAFGERYAQIAESFGAQVERLTFPMGTGIDPEVVKAKLQQAPGVRVVTLTHSETSTGVLHPIQAIAHAIHESSDALILVDAVSSAGSTRLATDAWGIDVVVTGTQKGLMSPPGCSILTVSARALRAHESARAPRFYWDWKEWRKWIAQGQTPITPALPIYYAMDAALDVILEEGPEAVWARHEKLAQLVRKTTAALGFDLAAEPRYASPVVTALRPPSGVKAGSLIARARDQYGAEFAGGQGEWTGKVLRIGHMGYAHEPEIQEALEALRQALADETLASRVSASAT